MLMALQNLTGDTGGTPATAPTVNYDSLDAAKRTLVDYRALSGLITDDSKDAGIRKMPLQELADKLGVTRQTLYDWQNSIPNFWDMVNVRRAQISPQSRLAMIEETWYMKARKGEWQHLNAWLLNYKPGYKTPAAKVEHEVGATLADLFKSVAANNPKIIEAEVTTSDSTAQA